MSLGSAGSAGEDMRSDAAGHCKMLYAYCGKNILSGKSVLP